MQVLSSDAGGKIIKFRKRKSMNGHGHPRIGPLMRLVIPHIAKRYAVCVAMPNPKDFLITSYDRMMQYHTMLNEQSEGHPIRWMMKLYMTGDLDPRDVERACLHPDFGGLKFYPAGLTTNSEEGIADPSLLWTRGSKPYECLRIVAQAKKPVSWHGADGFARADIRIENRSYRAGDELDTWDQECHFVDYSFPRVIDAHPDGIQVFEHLSTIRGIEFARKNPNPNVFYTVTAHHPMLDRRDMTRGGLRPMYWCQPVLQTFEHTQELRRFATEGRDDVGAGDDGASHPKGAKESGCCASGVNTTECSEELYAELFAEMGQLPHFEKFSALVMPGCYGIEPSGDYVVLERGETHPKSIFTCDDGTDVTGYAQPDRFAAEGVRGLNWRFAD